MSCRSLSNQGLPHSRAPLRIIMPTQNRVLARLSDKSRRRVLNHLTLIELPLGREVYDAGRREKYIYFPLTSIISSIHLMKNGDATEVALTGCEGMVGESLFING